MTGRTRFTGLLVASVLVPSTATPVLARRTSNAGRNAPMVTGLPAAFVFVAGAALLVYSVEKLIGFLTKAAVGLDLSLFGYIVSQESRRNTPIFRDSEVQEMLDGGVVRPVADDIPFVPDRELPGVAWLGLSILALAGLVVGAMTMSMGTEGIIALAGSIGIGSNVLIWHLPVLIVGTALAAYFISTGRLKPWHGYVLLGLYVAYWVVSFVMFGGAPIEV